MKVAFLFLFFCFSFARVFGQNFDSLETALTENHSQAERLELLNKAVYAGLFSASDKAEKYSDEAIALAKKLNSSEQLALSYRLRGVLYMEGYDKYLLSETYLDSAEKIFKLLKDSFGLAKTTNNRGALYYYRGKRADAEKCWKSAYEMFGQLNNKIETANVLFNLGNLMMDNGEYDKARIYYQNNLKVCEENNNLDGQAIAHIQIGNTYSETGKFDKAQPEFFKAISLSEKSGNNLYLNHALGYAAYIFKTMGFMDKAIQFYRRSYTVALSAGNKTAQANALMNLGNCYMDSIPSDSAFTMVKDAEKIYAELEDQRGIASCYRFYGDFFKSENNNTEALRQYLIAMSYPVALENNIFKGNILHLIGICYHDILKQDVRSRPDSLKSNAILREKASHYLEQARILAEANGNILILKNIHEVLATIYEEDGNYELALSNFRKFITYRDSIFSEETQVKIAELEARYDADLSKKQLALNELQLASARKDYWIIVSISVLLVIIATMYFFRYRKNLKAKQAAGLDEVRNRISRDLHDEVGSTLSVMNLLSHSAKKKIQNNEHDKAASVLNEMQQNAIQVQETMSDIVWNIKPESDKLENLIARMVEYTATMNETSNISISFNTEIVNDQLILTPVLKNNLYRVFKESINNCVRHAQCTEIGINLVINDSHLILEVRDNGKGFDMEKIRTGNGLRNIRYRIQETGGEFEIHSSSNGTVLKVSCQITISGDRILPHVINNFVA